MSLQSVSQGLQPCTMQPVIVVAPTENMILIDLGNSQLKEAIVHINHSEPGVSSVSVSALQRHQHCGQWKPHNSKCNHSCCNTISQQAGSI